MAINTLYDYYTSKGQELPSLADRSTIYEQYGLGAAPTYAGTAAQNTTLLQKLLTGQSAAPSPASVPAQASAGAAAATGANYASIAKDAGAAGISLSDLQGLFGPTPEEQKAARDAVARQFGYDTEDAFIADAFQKPSQTTEQFYQSAYEAAGLPTILSGITTKKDALNRAIGVVIVDDTAVAVAVGAEVVDRISKQRDHDSIVVEVGLPAEGRGVDGIEVLVEQLADGFDIGAGVAA